MPGGRRVLAVTSMPFASRKPERALRIAGVKSEDVM
jgi:hypothetical protein